MSAKHTPGPWNPAPLQPKSKPTDDQYLDVKSKEGKLVARVPAWASDMEANARLIAASPDLLSALDAALPILAGMSWANQNHNLFTIARDALAKARGEGGGAR